MTGLENIAHTVACPECGAAPGQWCELTAGVRTWAVAHSRRIKEATFARDLEEARKQA